MLLFKMDLRDGFHTKMYGRCIFLKKVSTEIRNFLVKKKRLNRHLGKIFAINFYAKDKCKCEYEIAKKNV